jgi:hypothetical protein
MTEHSRMTEHGRRLQLGPRTRVPLAIFGALAFVAVCAVALLEMIMR